VRFFLLKWGYWWQFLFLKSHFRAFHPAEIFRTPNEYSSNPQKISETSNALHSAFGNFLRHKRNFNHLSENFRSIKRLNSGLEKISENSIATFYCLKLLFLIVTLSKRPTTNRSTDFMISMNESWTKIKIIFWKLSKFQGVIIVNIEIIIGEKVRAL